MHRAVSVGVRRLHLVHHTDQDYDFSASLRLDPLESLYTVGYDVVVIFLRGPPIVAALTYQAFKIIWSIVARAKHDATKSNAFR